MPDGLYLNFGCLVTGFYSMFKKKKKFMAQKEEQGSCKFFQFLFWGGEMMAGKLLKQNRGKPSLAFRYVGMALSLI